MSHPSSAFYFPGQSLWTQIFRFIVQRDDDFLKSSKSLFNDLLTDVINKITDFQKVSPSPTMIRLEHGFCVVTEDI